MANYPYARITTPGWPDAIAGDKVIGRTLLYPMRAVTYRGTVVRVGEDSGDDITYLIRVRDTEVRANTPGARWKPAPDKPTFGFYCDWQLDTQPDGRLRFLVGGGVVGPEILPVGVTE